MQASDFKPGAFVVHLTGGPVHIVKFITSNDEVYCERWNGVGFIKETFSPETLRLATTAEVEAMKK